MEKDTCCVCDEEILDGEVLAPGLIFLDGVERRAHTECMLRSVIGGIGHHEDCSFWCGQMNDPDGGRSKRESARQVAAFYKKKCVEDALMARRN